MNIPFDVEYEIFMLNASVNVWVVALFLSAEIPLDQIDYLFSILLFAFID